MINKNVVAVSASYSSPFFIQMKKWKEELDKLHHRSIHLRSFGKYGLKKHA